METKRLRRVDLIFREHTVKYEVLDNTFKKSNKEILQEITHF